MSRDPKQACVECHFFVKETRTEDGRVLKFVVSPNERELCRSGDYSWQMDHYSIACEFGVWDQGVGFGQSTKDELVVKTNRRDFCFFWQHHPGMLLPAAKVLQQRESENRKASHDRRLTILGLWIAAFALLADVAMRFFEKLGWLSAAK
jgi:hypothetical protein